MSTPSLPWEKGFTPTAPDPDLIKQVSNTVAGPVAAATEAVLGSAYTTAENPPAAPTATNAPAGGGLGSVITQAAESSLNAALPAIQKRIGDAAAKAITDEINSLGGANPALPSIPIKDLTKLDAWERAARTFMVGIFVTLLGAVVQVIGQIAASGTSVDFFSKDGWTAVATLAVGAVVTSVSSYVLRFIREPVGAAVDSAKPVAN